MSCLRIKAYAGIGSRKAPDWALDLATRLGAALACQGWTLYSGAADGMDSAFEHGALQHKGAMAIFLPWPHFNHRHGAPPFVEPGQIEPNCKDLAELSLQLHPACAKLRGTDVSLLQRDYYQVHGATLVSGDTLPGVRFVVCFAPDPVLDAKAGSSTPRATPPRPSAWPPVPE